MRVKDLSLLAISANVILWSFFPLIAFFASDIGDVWAVAFYSQVFGALIAFAFTDKAQLVPRMGTAVRKAPFFFVAMSLASLFLLVFLVTSMVTIESTVAAVVLEFWPAIAFLLAARFVTKSWQDINATTFLILGGALVGLAITVASQVTVNGIAGGMNTVEWRLEGVVGVTFALIAAIMSAATILQTELALRVESASDFASASFIVLILRLIAVPVCLIGAIATSADLANMMAIWAGLAFGVTGYGLASILAIYGVRHAESIRAILLWFLAPPLGLIWLALVFDQPLSSNTILGFMVLFISNIFLNSSAIRRPALLYSTGGLLLAAVVVLRLPGLDSPIFFESLTVLTTFYVIFVAFVMARKSDLMQLEVDDVIRFAETASPEEINRARDDLMLHNTDLERKTDLSPIVGRLAMRRANSPILTELLVSAILAGTIILICLVFRGPSPLHDVVSISLVFIVVFCTFYLRDIARPATSWSNIAQILGGDTFRILRVKATLAIFSFVLFSIIAMIGLLIAEKHGAGILASITATS